MNDSAGETPSAPSSTLGASLAWPLIRAARLARLALDAALEPYGSTVNEYAILCVLVDTGAQSQKDLAKAVDLSEATLARLVETMERAGLVARVRPEENRRYVSVTPTTAGRDRQQHIFSAALQVDDALRATLPPGQDTVLCVLLAALGGASPSNPGLSPSASAGAQ